MVNDISSPVSDGGPIQANRVKCFPVRRHACSRPYRFSEIVVLARKTCGKHATSSAGVFQNARTTLVIGCTRPWQLIECCFLNKKKKTDKLLTAVASDSTRVWREYNTRVQFRPRSRTYATATSELHDPSSRNVRARADNLWGTILIFDLHPPAATTSLNTMFCTRF